MSEADIAENEAPDVIYESRFSFKFKLLVATSLAFVVTLFYTLSLKDTLNAVLERQLKNNPRCPINYQDVKLSFFLPSFSLVKPTISGRCLGAGRADIPLDHATLKITMPSFWPPGLKTHLQLKKNKTLLNVYPKLSPMGHDIRITNSKLNGAFLSSLSPYPQLLKGVINLEAHLQIKNNKVVKGDIRADSRTLSIPAQTIAGFNLMSLNLQTLELAGSLTKKQFKLKALKIGKRTSPLEAQFMGNVDLVHSNPRYSKLALSGKVRFSPEFVQNVSIINLFIGGKKKEGDYYPLSIGGTLAAPKPQFLNP